MALIVLEDAYEGVVLKDGSGDELLVSGISDQADEVVDHLVDPLGREVRGRRVGKCIKLVVLECRLLLVASPSKQLAGAGNLGNVGRVM